MPGGSGAGEFAVEAVAGTAEAAAKKPLTPTVVRVTMELLAKSKCHHSIGVST